LDVPHFPKLATEVQIGSRAVLFLLNDLRLWLWLRLRLRLDVLVVKMTYDAHLNWSLSDFQKLLPLGNRISDQKLR